jgi:hypothetical protein
MGRQDLEGRGGENGLRRERGRERETYREREREIPRGRERRIERLHVVI